MNRGCESTPLQSAAGAVVTAERAPVQQAAQTEVRSTVSGRRNGRINPLDEALLVGLYLFMRPAGGRVPLCLLHAVQGTPAEE